MTVESSETLNIFKALGDESRLRVLRALSVAELSVAELVRVLGLPQSTVSRHLKPLRDTGLVETRRNGTSVYYHRGPAFADGDFSAFLDRQWSLVPGDAEDRTSVRVVLDQRRSQSRDFFDAVAGRYGSLTEPGGGWAGVAAALAVGFAGRTVADLGSGEGALTLLLARFCRQVVAVDHAPNMLQLLSERAGEAGVSDRVRTAEGDLEALPLANASVDAAFLSQSLHHAAQPPQALAEAVRILRPGGRLVILDLVSHEQDWVREAYADLWLGFDMQNLKKHIRELGVQEVQGFRLPGATAELPVLLLTGIVP